MTKPDSWRRAVHQVLLGVLSVVVVAAGLWILIHEVRQGHNHRAHQIIGVGLVLAGLLPVRPIREGIVSGVEGLTDSLERIIRAVRSGRT